MAPLAQARPARRRLSRAPLQPHDARRRSPQTSDLHFNPVEPGSATTDGEPLSRSTSPIVDPPVERRNPAGVLKTSPRNMPSDYLLHINGDWRPARDSGALALVNPATEEV